MCGISGFNWNNKDLGEKMNRALVHRGPDASGVFVDEGITLAHRRLSIIDLSEAANQPMYSADGHYVIVFNGEIYNYKELRAELTGHTFRTESDTEVILEGYKEWGSEVVEKLNGIFAFAIWDKEKKELFCARDHIGVKPFFYYWDDGKFIFASEVKAILEHGVPRKIDLDSMNAYFRVLYVPAPRTMIKNIYKLEPGHILKLSKDNLKVDKYYRPTLEKEFNLNYAEAVKAVRSTVEKAVERQLVSDVPVGVYLSGGIDSSSILASVAKVKPDINTFSVGFELEASEERDKFNKDFELARITAKKFGTTHHELVLSAKDAVDNIERVIGSIDDPISNPTALPMALLAEFAKEEVTVVLAGDGGDELFGGYDRYRTSRRADALSKVPGLSNLLPRKVKQVVRANALERLALFEFEKDKKLEKVINPQYFYTGKSVEALFVNRVDENINPTTSFMLTDLTSWLPDYALALGDRMSMTGSLEERVPLLGREVVDLAMQIPLNYKVDIFKTKKVLKDAFRNVLPSELFLEKKMGWFAPGAKWLRNKEFSTVVYEVFSSGYYEGTKEVFNWPQVQRVLERHINMEEYNLTVIWAILTFQIWAKANKIQI